LLLGIYNGIRKNIVLQLKIHEVSFGGLEPVLATMSSYYGERSNRQTKGSVALNYFKWLINGV